METYTITLHAVDGAQLMAARVRETVVATAQELGERFGIPVSNVVIDGDALSATLECDEIAAVGFAAELRRNSNAWHQAKFGRPLWKTPQPDTD